jgi:hypothetical protein
MLRKDLRRLRNLDIETGGIPMMQDQAPEIEARYYDADGVPKPTIVEHENCIVYEGRSVVLIFAKESRALTEMLKRRYPEVAHIQRNWTPEQQAIGCHVITKRIRIVTPETPAWLAMQVATSIWYLWDHKYMYALHSFLRK